MTHVWLGLALWATVIGAQEAPQQPHVMVATIPARPEDVSTIGGLMKAFYEVISGPAGQPRQWARDRSLYRPDVRFVAMSERDGKPSARIMSHQEYVDGSDTSFVKNGFFEIELRKIVWQFGNMAHVWSTYETRQSAGGRVTERGINSLQLYFDGTRWWVASVEWEEERKNNPIPAAFLR